MKNKSELKLQRLFNIKYFVYKISNVLKLWDNNLMINDTS